jgi:autotransporter-associated beta strand protein
MDGLNFSVGEWVFSVNASQYSFTLGTSLPATLDFAGLGIVATSGSPVITILSNSSVFFDNASSAGSATILENGHLGFRDVSTAGDANITNNGGALAFADDTSAGSATINIVASGTVRFIASATGGDAQFSTDGTSFVDFSKSAGPRNDHRVSAGSIAGAGTYFLGVNQLTVGSNNLPAIVSGSIDDGGSGGGIGASLVKMGRGVLTLAGASSTYSGGTTIEQGVLDLAAVGAAGTGAISFAGKLSAKLNIENGALTGQSLAYQIDSFAVRDTLDLAGLHFHAGAKATYHKATHHLTVRSGTVTDTLTLFFPKGTHFVAAKDGHGGTKITLDPPPATAHAVASLAGHDLNGEWASDLCAGSNHMSDFLFAG